MITSWVGGEPVPAPATGATLRSVALVTAGGALARGTGGATAVLGAVGGRAVGVEAAIDAEPLEELQTTIAAINKAESAVVRCMAATRYWPRSLPLPSHG